MAQWYWLYRIRQSAMVLYWVSYLYIYVLKPVLAQIPLTYTEYLLAGYIQPGTGLNY